MATIRKKSENTYQFRVSVGLGANNRYKFKYKTYKVTDKMTPKKLESHLEQEAFKFEKEVLSNSYIAPTGMTFSKFAGEWETKWLEKEVTENTIILRLNSLRNHILPVIGHQPISKITTLMLLDLMENLTRKDGKKGDLSISSKQEVHKVLVSIFSRAVEWSIIKENPISGVKMPSENRKQERKVNIYDEKEVNVLLTKLQFEPYHWRFFIKLSLATGMRRGELVGLEWKHIDIENQVINIQQIISKTRNGGFEIKAPKYNSKRSISIPSSMLNDLKTYKLHCQKERIKLQHNWEENQHDWVFFNENGSFFRPDTPTKWWSKFLERTGLRKIRLHDLRHTSATLLIAQNVHVKIISERLGHKKTSTTMDIYGHVTPAADKDASEKLNTFLTIK